MGNRNDGGGTNLDRSVIDANFESIDDYNRAKADLTQTFLTEMCHGIGANIATNDIDHEKILELATNVATTFLRQYGNHYADNADDAVLPSLDFGEGMLLALNKPNACMIHYMTRTGVPFRDCKRAIDNGWRQWLFYQREFTGADDSSVFGDVVTPEEAGAELTSRATSTR